MLRHKVIISAATQKNRLEPLGKRVASGNSNGQKTITGSCQWHRSKIPFFSRKKTTVFCGTKFMRKNHTQQSNSIDDDENYYVNWLAWRKPKWRASNEKALLKGRIFIVLSKNQFFQQFSPNLYVYLIFFLVFFATLVWLERKKCHW